MRLAPAPSFGNRPLFCGSPMDYEWLARWFGFHANVIPIWRGTGTALIVLSKAGEPLPTSDVEEFRAVLKDWTVVGTILTVVSVG